MGDVNLAWPVQGLQELAHDLIILYVAVHSIDWHRIADFVPCLHLRINDRVRLEVWRLAREVRGSGLRSHLVQSLA